MSVRIVRFASSLAVAVVVTVLAGVAGLSAQRTASACTSPPGGLPQKTITDRVQAANMTLEGTVVRLEGEPGIGQQKATIRVDRFFTRNGSALTHVDGYGSGALCLTELTLGQHGIFFVEFTNDGYRASYLTQFDAVAPATPDNIAEAIAAAGQEPSLPEAVTRVRAAGLAKSQLLGGAAAMERGSPREDVLSLAGTSLAFAGLGALGLMVRRRR